MFADTGTWLPIIVIGAMLVGGGRAYARFAKQSWNWAVADAVITKIGKLSMRTHLISGSNRWDTSLNVHLEYLYTAGGEQWKNEHIARWRSTGQKEIHEAAEFRLNNPVGKRFQLLFNPNNPFDSLLNGPRDPTAGSVIAMFGLAMAIIALINWIFDPPGIAQIVLLAGGMAACAGAFALTNYPFKRPWWFEKSEEKAEKFMQESVSMKQPDGFHKFRMWSD